MKHASDDCPHLDFEPVKDPPRYIGPVRRCVACRTVWAVVTEPVQRWMAATGQTPSGDVF